MGEKIGGNSEEGSLYKALDSLCNGAMLSAALATESVTGFFGMLAITGLTSATYQLEDMDLDDKYGNDFWDEDVTVLSFLSTMILDAASATYAAKINLFLKDSFKSIMNKYSKKAVNLPKLDTKKWAALLNKYTKYKLNLDQANVNVNKKLVREILSKELDKIYSNVILRSALFGSVSLPSNLFCDTILSDMFGDIKEVIVKQEDYKSSILEGEEYFYFDEKGKLQVE